jgi:hypothetical protein
MFIHKNLIAVKIGINIKTSSEQKITGRKIKPQIKKPGDKSPGLKINILNNYQSKPLLFKSGSVEGSFPLNFL